MNQNLREAMQRIACEESARFIMANLPQALSFETPGELRAFALQEALKIEGLVCEFGVFDGRTINEIAVQTERKVYGFDSFAGLPENWRTGFHIGAFATGGLPAVAENVELIPGLFECTLPRFFANHRKPVAFAHVDCDLYSSTQTVLEYAGPWIVPGTVLVFDEMFNYPSWQTLGEFSAWMKFAATRNIRFEWLAYCSQHEQAAIKML